MKNSFYANDLMNGKQGNVYTYRKYRTTLSVADLVVNIELEVRYLTIGN
jgi:hypothetical protein